MSSAKSEVADPMPESDWSFIMPMKMPGKSKNWHRSVTQDERKESIGKIMASLIKKGDLKIYEEYDNMGGQTYMSRLEESHIFEKASSKSEYYKKIEEKTQEIADWDLDQEENIKSFGLDLMKFGQKLDDEFGLGWDDPSNLRTIVSMHRRKTKKARKENKNVVNVTITEDREYNIEDVLQSLEVSEASSKKPKSKKKKKGKKKSDSQNNDHADKKQTSAQDQEDPKDLDPTFDKAEAEPLANKNVLELLSGLECSTCFEPRIRTFLLLPCGHATFCEKCATHFCESEEKRCPTCRATVTGKVRVFL